MPQHTPQPLGDLLGELFERRGYQARIDGARAVAAWPEVVVAGAARATERAWFKDGVLTVKLRSAAWRATLHVQREAWRERLNEHLGSEVVREIVVR